MTDTAAPNVPYLSIVVTARNDDHGGALLSRMQAFVGGWIEQAKRFGISSELIIVEWNPPGDRPRLKDVLEWPDDFGPCQVRFIEVPAELHRRYRHAEQLPLYQMIAKNVGVRRARGNFILASNIDILFSDELAAFLSSRTLRDDRMYRIDRHDAMSDLPSGRPVEEQIEYCLNHLIRINRREGTFPVQPDGSPLISSKDVVAPDAGVIPGRGWFPVEFWDPQQPFRWATDCVELYLKPRGGAGLLKLHVMPGTPAPGVGTAEEPIRLDAMDQDGKVFASVLLDARGWWRIPFDGPIPERILLRAWGRPPFTGVDPRPLMFRVFRIEWEDREPARAKAASEDPVEEPPIPAQERSPHPSDQAICSADPSALPPICRAEWVPDRPPTGQIEPLSKANMVRSTWRSFQFLIERIANSEPHATFAFPVTPGMRKVLQAYVRSGGITGILRHGVVRPPAPASAGPIAFEAPAPIAFAAAAGAFEGPPGGETATPFIQPSEQLDVPAPPALEPRIQLSRRMTYVPSSAPPAFLHTNGCGDFTLLARERWFDLRGYPEFDVFSMNLDSVFCFMAHHGGAREEVLREPMRIFHIEHGTGSGWTPEGQKQLFERIWAKGMSFIDNEEVLRWGAQMRRLDAPMIFNRGNWGLAEFELKDTALSTAVPASSPE